MKKPPAVRRFSRNMKGRDFVVSDIHGAYDLVLEAMRKVSFDGNVDRLFVGGDMVDRGKGSHRCLRFLQQNYIHAIMGNHEAAFIELYENERPSEEVLRYVCRFNGMGWWLKESEASRDAILN